jgi:hypothetical protein
MNDFDFGQYDPDHVSAIKSNKKPIRETPSSKESEFNFADYDPTEEEKPFFGQYAHLTRGQYHRLSPEKKKELQEYVPLTGVGKGFVSAVTLGESETTPELKIKEHEVGAGFGKFLGVTVPIAFAGLGAGALFRLLGPATKVGELAMLALGVGEGATTGAIYGIAKETAKATRGEGFDVGEVAAESAMFGGLSLLFKGVPAAYRWFKGIPPDKQAKMLATGHLPEDLSPAEYNMFERDIYPQLRQAAEEEYTAAYQKAVEENDLAYTQELANTRAQHEDDLYRLSKEKESSSQDFLKSQQDYQNKLRQVAAEHEIKVQQIEVENQEAIKAFEEQQKVFEQMKKRQNIVSNAIRPQEGGESLAGRVTQHAEGLPFRPSPGIDIDPRLDNRIGNVISPNRITNTTNAGRANIQAVRANDAIDRQDVNDAYTRNRELNSQVVTTHQGLVDTLTQTANELRQIPQLSPPQQQLLHFVEAIIRRAQIIEEGIVIGLNPMSNELLESQAQAMRYQMDYTFEHGNTKGIFSPTVNAIEDAIETAAEITGNPEAAEANRAARALHRQWSIDYNNDYIRTYRDVSNLNYSDTFNKSLSTDNFNVLDNILRRSNAGQQLSGTTRRALVEKKLGKFLNKPREANIYDFYRELDELEAVISFHEKSAIKEQFLEARRTRYIPAKKITTQAAEIPKVKEVPTAKIPLFKAKPKKVREITQVSIPTKKPLQPTAAMKAAGKKLNRTNEQMQAMTNTRTGIRKLEDEMMKLKNGKELYDKMARDKMKQMFYKGNVKHKITCKELHETINTGNNYAILSEIIGDNEAKDLLLKLEELGNKSFSGEILKKAGMKIAHLKILHLFGII